VPLPDHSVDGDGTSLNLFNKKPETEREDEENEEN
jgi:hypothetical protein